MTSEDVTRDGPRLPAIRLGYVGVEVSDLPAWEKFGRDGIGFHVEYCDEKLIFRLDERSRRIILWEGPRDDVAWFGWEVDGAEELSAVERHLRSLSIDVRPLSASDAALRGVGQAIAFSGPMGLPFEIYCDPVISDQPLKLNGLSAFAAGSSGIGHIAVLVENMADASEQIKTMIGANPTDWVEINRNGVVTSIAFLHSNQRHHSFAIAETSGPRPEGMKTIAHLMVEVATLEDVGAASIRCKRLGYRIPRDVGLHENDGAISFYVVAPSAFQLEVAYGPVQIEEGQCWETSTYDTDSRWGHKPFN
ncbi:VOC family protein [Sphingomonas sp. SRS2]|uniref:VOC family protein n=1 Tax=Sphingomonas sp. SRS2 TaxID=133190 RepID=UPI000A03C0AE|nr:VOC family protein [Sphingomonas sp. SRS2]